MGSRIEIGMIMSTDNVPRAFYKWFADLKEKYEFATIEVGGGEIRVVRVKTPVDGVNVVEHLRYGKITSDTSGEFLERTFVPRYSKEKDEIILEQ